MPIKCRARVMFAFGDVEVTQHTGELFEFRGGEGPGQDLSLRIAWQFEADAWQDAVNRLGQVCQGPVLCAGEAALV